MYPFWIYRRSNYKPTIAELQEAKRIAYIRRREKEYEKLKHKSKYKIHIILLIIFLITILYLSIT